MTPKLKRFTGVQDVLAAVQGIDAAMGADGSEFRCAGKISGETGGQAGPTATHGTEPDGIFQRSSYRA